MKFLFTQMVIEELGFCFVICLHEMKRSLTADLVIVKIKFGIHWMDLHVNSYFAII